MARQVLRIQVEVVGGQKELFSPQVKRRTMASTLQHDVREPRPFYSIPELAARWRCSRATVYNVIRGEKVLDLAADGKRKKSHKLVPFDVVLRIERDKLKVFR